VKLIKPRKKEKKEKERENKIGEPKKSTGRDGGKLNNE
jgi:hypothetical protein